MLAPPRLALPTSSQDPGLALAQQRALSLARGLPFDASVRPGQRTARYNSLRYVLHQTGDFVSTLARAPFAAESYARVNHLWGLATLVEGQVYRSAEPRPLHFAHVRRLGIRTLLCVKRTLPAAPTLAFARQDGLAIARVDLGPDHGIELSALARVLQLLSQRELWPILLHCDGGRHRTGMVSAALRCAQGWSLSDALTEYDQLSAPTPRAEDRDVICAWYAQRMVQATPARATRRAA